MAIVLAACAQPLWAQQSLPSGGEFQVNTYTTLTQRSAAVSSTADAGFIVVWDSSGSSGSDSSNGSVQGQRYAPDGTAVGSEFQVNTSTAGLQYNPSVSVAADGDFVVVWVSNGSSGSDSSSYSVQGQRYASDGAAVGSEFQINTYTTSFQVAPSVSANAVGDFVVVWHSYGSGAEDSSSYSIQGRRYASDGTPLGSEFQVNTYTTEGQYVPSVSTAADGDFVVVWVSYSSDTDSSPFSVQGQRYASDGTALGSQFQVNTYTTSSQTRPSVSGDAEGGFVVAWASAGSGAADSSGDSIQVQRYASNGTPLGSEFQVNTYTTGSQYAPSVSVEADGDFVVVWQSTGSIGADSSSNSIHGQRFASDGSAVGSEFEVNTYTTSYQVVPSVSVAMDGDFVVVWESDGSSGTDSSSFSVQGQRYVPSLFGDGFESGDTSAWSSTIP